MKLKRKCKICGNSFVAIKTTQFFCCRKCFKRDYYNRTKIRLRQQEQAPPNYPIKECSFCEKRSKLNFDPLEHPKLYDTWQCPYCGVTNSLIWKHQNDSNSHQIISNILMTMDIQINTTPLYQTYKLPIISPEQGNPAFIVMTCESLDITEIQKQNRKKILFS